MGLYEKLCFFPFVKDEEEEQAKKKLKEKLKWEKKHTEISIKRTTEKFERKQYYE